MEKPVSALGYVLPTPGFHIPITGYVRLPDVLKVFPVSRSTWWAGVKSGRFPKGHKLSERVTAWKAEDIHALLQSRGE